MKVLTTTSLACSFFDQFELIRLIPIHPFGNLDISLTNSSLFMLLAVFYFAFVYKCNVAEGLMVPGRYQSVVEIVYSTVYGMVKDNMEREGFRFFPLIMSLFVFIATMNLFGLIPYTFAPTTHIVVTLGLSFSIFIACVAMGFINHQIEYFSMFMPNGAPMVLGPILIVIELVSHFNKALSLGLRLAANITAGHLLFAILSSFAWQMVTAGGLVTVAAAFPIAIGLFITVLEMAVSCIQAYVFCLLTVIYINESIHLH